MKAYVQAIRYYNDALANGKIAGKNGEDVVAIMAKYSTVKDPAVIRKMTAHAVDPNGSVNVDSLKKDWTFFKEQKQINGNVQVDQVVDLSFVNEAASELGPYKAAH
jgi:NitT/TauT family transport system substrate-binding protein